MALAGRRAVPAAPPLADGRGPGQRRRPTAGAEQQGGAAAADHNDDGDDDDYQLFHDRPSLADPDARSRPAAPGQALSGSRSRWLTTAETPSPRMLIPYSVSATSMVRC